MSTGIPHDDARDALAALALDTLDVSERSAVLAHLARCAECREELAALSVTAGELSYAIKPVPMPSVQGEVFAAWDGLLTNNPTRWQCWHPVRRMPRLGRFWVPAMGSTCPLAALIWR